MITFTVPGRPIPKARPRLGVHGRTAYIYTPEETRLYEQFVGVVGCENCRKPLTGPVELRLVAFFRGGRRTPDLSNVLKAVEDGLNGIAYIDDSQVKRFHAEMRYVEDRTAERVEVEIHEVEEAAG